MRSCVMVTGATGEIGRELCRLLMEAGAAVRGATRDPARGAESGTAVAGWVELDYDRPEGFPAALEGVDRLFLMARPGDDHPEVAAGPLLDAAREAGVRRVVNLTALGAERRPDVPLRQVELLVEEGGFAFTHLRPNWFMQVFSGGPLLEGIRATGRLAIPAGDARISYIDARDVSAVAARALLEDGHAGRAYDLTGGAALSHAEIAAAIGEASGRAIEYVPLDEDQARPAIMASGLSAPRAERLIRFYRLVREGLAAPVSPAVETILGRAPMGFDRFATDRAAAWR